MKLETGTHSHLHVSVMINVIGTAMESFAVLFFVRFWAKSFGRFCGVASGDESRVNFLVRFGKVLYTL